MADRAGRRRAAAAGVLIALLSAGAACAPAPEVRQSGAAASADADVRVVGGSAASGLQVFEVRRGGRLFQVDIGDVGGGARRVVVTLRAARGLQPADARLAYEAALAAAGQVDCGGEPLLILAETATFQEQDRSTVLVRGAPAYVFDARCG